MRWYRVVCMVATHLEMGFFSDFAHISPKVFYGKFPDLRTFFRRISAFRALQHPLGSSDSVEFPVRCPSWLHQTQVLQGCWSERLRCLNASSSACTAKAPPLKIFKNDNFDMSWAVLNTRQESSEISILRCTGALEADSKRLSPVRGANLAPLRFKDPVLMSHDMPYHWTTKAECFWMDERTSSPLQACCKAALPW